MNILLLNQTFYPDVMATGQYLTQVALALAERGHQVTVVTSQRAYDDPNTRFAPRERWRGVEIYRIACTGFGKGTKWRRAADFASFMLSCCWRLLLLPRHDVVVALTSPPLISFLGAWVSKLRRSRFVYWVMDLNPDEAIAAGWLRPGSWVARVLDRMSRFSLRQADSIVVLDRFMRERVAAKGIAPGNIEVIPPWAHDDAVRYDPKGREQFRKAHGLEGKFVVMYSGNHSPCHPLGTLLEAARRLGGPQAQGSEEVVFCFVGGGSEWRKIRGEGGGVQSPKSKVQSGEGVCLCLPYQPLEELAGSLSAADLHVVVMGDGFVGTIHPCKIYNILSVAAPVLYIGPKPSHVSEILDAMEGHPLCAWARHGEVERVMEYIERVRATGARRDCGAFANISAQFSKSVLLPRMVAVLESTQKG